MLKETSEADDVVEVDSAGWVVDQVVEIFEHGPGLECSSMQCVTVRGRLQESETQTVFFQIVEFLLS